jgi:hypothetical protein
MKERYRVPSEFCAVGSAESIDESKNGTTKATAAMIIYNMSSPRGCVRSPDYPLLSSVAKEDAV